MVVINAVRERGSMTNLVVRKISEEMTFELGTK